MPGESEHIAGSGLKDVRTERVGAIAWPVKVRMNPAAYNSDRRDTSLLERDVISAGKEFKEIELVCDPNCLSRFERDGEGVKIDHLFKLYHGVPVNSPDYA